jgi:tetratricopeptide (TPR) repeat protein
MKKTLVVVIFLFVVNINFGQSKNEQIIILQNSVDSIKKVYEDEKLNNKNLTLKIDSITKLIVKEYVISRDLEELNKTLKNEIDMNKRKFDSLNLLIQHSCNSINDTSSLDVSICYNESVKNRNFEKAYDLLSTRSKDNFSFVEFKQKANQLWNQDFNLKFIDSIIEIQKNIDYPSYRRFKVKTIAIRKNEIYSMWIYQTYAIENNVWKRVFVYQLLDTVEKKITKGDFNGSIQSINNLLSIDPFNAYGYSLLAYCIKLQKKKDRKLNKNEFNDKILHYLQYAISLEPELYEHYYNLAIFYNEINEDSLSIEYLNKALKLSIINDNDSRVKILNSLGNIFTKIKDKNKAYNYFKKSLTLDSTNIVTKNALGITFNSIDCSYKALEFFENIDESKIPNYLKESFYVNYSIALKNTRQVTLAKKFILKALKLSPNEQHLKDLYRKINNPSIHIISLREGG